MAVEGVLKSLGKMLVGFVLMLAVAAGSGYVSFLITSNMVQKKLADDKKVITTNISSTPVVQETGNGEIESKPVSYDYYIVRLEGENLGIYACNGGKEEFLYNEAVFVRDLSDDDLKLLKEGVKLQNTSELTGFVENFTS